MRLPFLIVMIGAATQLGNTDCGQVLRDSGFDLWCGNALCAWKVERGDIKKVSTWNKGDPGVELVGNDVAIEQLAPVDSGDGSCIEISMVANVDASVDVELNVDVFGDGTVEHNERLPAANWKPLTYDVLIQPPYRGIRFEIAKTGAGKAQLANIGARVLSEQGSCAGLTPIIPGPAQLGAECGTLQPDTCASDICEPFTDPNAWLGFSGVCAGCDATHPCDAGHVCGLHEPTSPVREASHGCVAQASKELGERCDLADECASGQCISGRCSSCSTSCATCAAAWTNGPSVCNAGQHLGATGAACGTDDDCASAVCAGTERRECSDGRPCGSALDCEFGTGSDAPLMNGACTTVGIQGGTCR